MVPSQLYPNPPTPPPCIDQEGVSLAKAAPPYLVQTHSRYNPDSTSAKIRMLRLLFSKVSRAAGSPVVLLSLIKFIAIVIALCNRTCTNLCKYDSCEVIGTDETFGL